MLGVLVEIALSWLLLWLIDKKNLGVLGLRPTVIRVKAFLLLLLAAVLCSLLAVGLRVMFFKEQYEVNPQLSVRLVWEGFRWNLVSVLYEEFIFRGALLYLLIKRIGVNKGILVSAIAFGIYHWFSYNAFGNAVAMLQIFLMTGIMGWILAYGFVRSCSMYMATGFHLGWNFTYGFLFSKGSIGNGVWVMSAHQQEVTVSYFTFYTVTFIPYVIAYIASFLLMRREKVIG